MIRKWMIWPFVFILCAWQVSVSAKEKILQYHSDIVVQANGELLVTETITVQAEGKQIRRGLYRDFPTQYRDAQGDTKKVGFDPLTLLRDGKPEPWFTEAITDGVRINFGDDSLLPTPLQTTYTFRYRTNRQLRVFDHHDELYWNVTGNGWVFPIEKASARIELPKPVTADQLQLNYYTGAYGARGQNASATVQRPGVITFATTSPLPARHGLTAVVGFPKNIVAQPGLLQQIYWLLRDYWLLFIPLLGVGGVTAFYIFEWRRNGVDPLQEPVFPRYHPPEGLSPGFLRFTDHYGYDNRCLAADIVLLGTRGCLTIRQQSKRKWELHKQAAPNEAVTPSEVVALWKSLFLFDGILKLGGQSNSRLIKAQKRHEKLLKRRAKPHYWIDNTQIALKGFLASAVVVGITWGLLGIFDPSWSGWLMFALVGVILPLNILFKKLLRRPTAEGNQLLAYIKGFRLYMRVASKDDLARVQLTNEPSLDGKRFQELLPYALALDVEDAWTQRFIDAVGLAAATQSMKDVSWSPTSDIHVLGKEISDSLLPALNNSTAPESSSSGGSFGSSGGGGGGFSGGGGGGGGGGGR